MYRRGFTRRTYLILIVSVLLSSCGSGGSGGADGSDIVLSFGVLDWVFPTQREDNSPLLLSEISSSHVYYGTETGDYLRDVQVNYPNSSLELLSTNFTSGTYYFVVTTVDSAGRESLYSDEVVLTF